MNQNEMNDNVPPSEAIRKRLDAKGLVCPEPVMLLHRAVREVGAGEMIEMLATDPSTERDVPKFCLFLGHELVSQIREGDEYRYYIRKSS